MEDITRLGELLPRFIGEILTAIICGGLIGLERVMHRKTAALRDNILVCVGVVLYMIFAELCGLTIGTGSLPGISLIASSVIIGAALLGVGVIVRNDPDQAGFTTAATLWIVAAIGLIIGSGNSLMGMLVTGVVLLMLTMLAGIEKHLKKKPRPLLLKLVLREDSSEVRQKLQELLDRHNVKPDKFHIERGPFGVRVTIQATEEPEDIRLLTTDLWTIQGVTEVEH